jgi:hypothetical protein
MNQPVDNDELWRRLEALALEAQSRTEATNADPKTVVERRYDLGEARWEDMYSHDLELWWAVRNTFDGGACKWQHRLGNPLYFTGDLEVFAAQYERTTDEYGIECWVRRES